MQTTFPYAAAFSDSCGRIYVAEGGEVRSFATQGCVFDLYTCEDGFVYGSISGQGSGLVRCDKDGTVLARYHTKNEVFGVHPLPDGYLVGELTGKCVTVLDKNLQPVRSIPVPYHNDNMHEVMRGVHPAKDGGVYVVQPGDCMIRHLSEDGIVLEEVPTGPDTFGMEELADGTILYTQHLALCCIDHRGNERWRVDAADIEEAGLCWALNFKTLPNGHILLINWLGHGCEEKGYPVIELDAEHRMCGLYKIGDATCISDITLLS